MNDVLYLMKKTLWKFFGFLDHGSRIVDLERGCF